MLELPIKRKWFDMIVSGEKKEEYREIKPYWTKRFGNYFIGTYVDKTITFRNGYGENRSSIKCTCLLREGQGKEEWGAESNKEYYVLEILEILEVSNVNESETNEKRYK
ncbi:MAG: ASCH domain-containing protein [Clostridia bacterium]|jgi:hypothetical protein|nr:ASCH domain-containing protein [Clostridia bacterium]